MAGYLATPCAYLATRENRYLATYLAVDRSGIFYKNICQAKNLSAAVASGCLGKPNVPLTLSPSIPGNKIITNQ